MKSSKETKLYKKIETFREAIEDIVQISANTCTKCYSCEKINRIACGIRQAIEKVMLNDNNS